MPPRKRSQTTKRAEEKKTDSDDNSSSLPFQPDGSESKKKKKKKSHGGGTKTKSKSTQNSASKKRKATVKRSDDDDVDDDDNEVKTMSPKPDDAVAADAAQEDPEIFDLTGAEFMPSFLRKTDRGGYAHTDKSRLKISKANRGKVPWNKGKNRSETSKAKIAAGVRARNRDILLKKLRVLGMTEDEWIKKGKEIKSFREKLRKAKKANAEREAALLYKQQQAQNEVKVTVTAEKTEDDPSACDDSDGSVATGEDRESEDKKEMEQNKTSSDVVEAPLIEDDAEALLRNDNIEEESEHEDEHAQIPPMLSIFAPDIHWKPHPFTTPKKDEPVVTYDQICPKGGPGGLICCSVCTATYSRFMSLTYQDMEEQKTSKTAREVRELLDFTREARLHLLESVRAARKKPPPLLKKAGNVAPEAAYFKLKKKGAIE